MQIKLGVDPKDMIMSDICKSDLGVFNDNNSFIKFENS